MTTNFNLGVARLSTSGGQDKNISSVFRHLVIYFNYFSLMFINFYPHFYGLSGPTQDGRDYVPEF